MQVISSDGLSIESSDAEGLFTGEELSEYGGVIDGLTVSTSGMISEKKKKRV